MRYRLQPAQKGFVIYDNDGPSDDEVELNGAFGWKYVAKYGVFHIYRADDIDARRWTQTLRSGDGDEFAA